MSNVIDLYQLLGVQHNATEDEIKKAFREKARRFHPDVNNDPNASELFQNYYTAYQILTDPTKRGVYNLLLSQKLRKKSSQTRAARTYERMHRQAQHRSQRASAGRYSSIQDSDFGMHGWALQIIFTISLAAMSLGLLAIGLHLMFNYAFNGHLLSSYVLLAIGTYTLNETFDALLAMHYALKGNKMDNKRG